MLDLATLRMVHRHGDHWAELKHVEHHDPSQHDPERQWLKGGHEFRCDCGESVVVLPEREPVLPGEHLE